MNGDADGLAPKLAELRESVQPILKDDPELQSWCTDGCLERYLRARKLDVRKAEKMLKNTLEWRKSYKPHEIRWEDVREEGRTGKNFVTNISDREGRVLILMRPRCENTKVAEHQIKYLVYNLETASQMADAKGITKMTWLIDFEGYSMWNAPPLSTSLQTLSILQNHYPERLGLAIVYHPPALFNMTWKVCKPFIDPGTYKKIVFCEKGKKGRAVLERLLDMDVVEEGLGGKAPPLFDYEAYDKQQLAAQAAQAPASQPASTVS